VPTWNFIVAHLYGTPQLLNSNENTTLLKRFTQHFERHVENPVTLDDEVLTRLAPETVGLRLPIDRLICKVKMSQDESPVTQAQILSALRHPGPYSNLTLADQMQRTLEPHR
jgi:transcriptional regulator